MRSAAYNAHASLYTFNWYFNYVQADINGEKTNAYTDGKGEETKEAEKKGKGGSNITTQNSMNVPY